MEETLDGLMQSEETGQQRGNGWGTQRGKVEQMGLKAQVEGTAAMKIP